MHLVVLGVTMSNFMISMAKSSKITQINFYIKKLIGKKFQQNRAISNQDIGS